MSSDKPQGTQPVVHTQPTSLHGVSISSAMPDDIAVAGAPTIHWMEEKRITPKFAPQIGKTHVFKEISRADDGTVVGNNWAGSVLTGNWTEASGIWTIPTVTKNIMPQGSKQSGWTSAS